ncbi:MAG: thioredoxin family protein [Acidimicrobiia bacterium]|nr:thioredoxin family protein [Acidimicrobiia bacterium]
MNIIRHLITLLVVASALGAVSGPAAAQEVPDPWYTVEGDEVTLDFYFYWSPTCPHCQEAKPFIEDLPSRYPWLEFHSYDVTDMSDVEIDFVIDLQREIDQEITGVPAFLFCEQLYSGYDEAETTGAFLETQLTSCYEELTAGLEPELAEEPISVPIFGEVDPENVSLPFFTVTLAALDAFNPCAFFVLLFLLSLLVHARSRSRMAVIGGIFVLFSGVIYFLFMAAWLNVFLWLGPLRIITAVAGAVAVTLAAVNIKDYFAVGVGPSLSIPDSAKPGLFKRMRGLTAASSFGAVAIGAATLAVVANSYELLCTTGFPLAFTRVLTLSDLPTGTYYSYLLLYNLVYVLPLLVIVGVFVWRLGSRKLGEWEGRILKLLSGTMMAGLGLVLLFNPDLLSNVLTSILLLAGAITITLITALVDRRRPAGASRES